MYYYLKSYNKLIINTDKIVHSENYFRAIEVLKFAFYVLQNSPYVPIFNGQWWIQGFITERGGSRGSQVKSRYFSVWAVENAFWIYKYKSLFLFTI